MTETKPTSPVTSTRAGEEMIQAIFDAIAAATRIDNDPDGWHRIVIDAAKFIEVFNSHCDRKLCTSLVEPSLLGRETVRESVAAVTGAGSNCDELLKRAETYLHLNEADGRGSALLVMELADALRALSPLKE